MKMKIPKRIQVGGQDIEVKIIKDIQGGVLGECLLGQGVVNIAENYKGYTQCESSKLNTFVHECVHLILDTMGSHLSGDEQFVRTFAGFVTEIIKSIERQNVVQCSDGHTTS